MFGVLLVAEKNDARSCLRVVVTFIGNRYDDASDR